LVGSQKNLDLKTEPKTYEEGQKPPSVWLPMRYEGFILYLSDIIRDKITIKDFIFGLIQDSRTIRAYFTHLQENIVLI
jgi:hypothetical protein